MSTENLNTFVSLEDDEGVGKLYFSQNYKRTGSIIGYTGNYPNPIEPLHALKQPMEKQMIRGYTGHRPHRKNIVGSPLIKSDSGNLSPTRSEENAPRYNTVAENFRAYAKHLDLEERYATAIQVLEDNGSLNINLQHLLQSYLIHNFFGRTISDDFGESDTDKNFRKANFIF